MSKQDYSQVRVRRADLIRLKSSLEELGGMYLTDAFHVLSYTSPAELFGLSSRAGHRKQSEWQARRDAGETFSAVHRGDDTDERDTDDVTPEEIAVEKRRATMGRIHKAEAWRGHKK